MVPAEAAAAAEAAERRHHTVGEQEAQEILSPVPPPGGELGDPGVPFSDVEEDDYGHDFEWKIDGELRLGFTHFSTPAVSPVLDNIAVTSNSSFLFFLLLFFLVNVIRGLQ